MLENNVANKKVITSLFDGLWPGRSGGMRNSPVLWVLTEQQAPASVFPSAQKCVKSAVCLAQKCVDVLPGVCG